MVALVSFFLSQSSSGGSQIAGTKIVMPNGSIDPWHALSVLNTTNTGIVPIFIDGTAHWFAHRMVLIVIPQRQHAATTPQRP
jgi:hypothetical protein